MRRAVEAGPGEMRAFGARAVHRGNDTRAFQQVAAGRDLFADKARLRFDVLRRSLVPAVLPADDRRRHGARTVGIDGCDQVSGLVVGHAGHLLIFVSRHVQVACGREGLVVEDLFPDDELVAAHADELVVRGGSDTHFRRGLGGCRFDLRITFQYLLHGFGRVGACGLAVLGRHGERQRLRVVRRLRGIGRHGRALRKRQRGRCGLHHLEFGGRVGEVHRFVVVIDVARKRRAVAEVQREGFDAARLVAAFHVFALGRGVVVRTACHRQRKTCQRNGESK